MFQNYNTDCLNITNIFSATVNENDIGKKIRSFGETKFYQLGIKLKGKTSIIYNNKEYVYDDNSVLYLPCESRNDIKYNKVYRKPGFGVCIFFTSRYPLDTEAKIYKINNSSIINDFKEILHTFKKDNMLKTKSIFYEILSLLDESEKNARGNAMFDILNYINEHACDSYIDLRELAAKFGFSADYFRRKFSEEVGLSPKKYISSIKIKLAKELLLNSEIAIYQVAYKVGFDDYNYFTRFFKKETGYTPLHFRKKFKNYF